MAQRGIRTEGDDILRKKSKEVKEINEGILTLLDDMYETMLATDGVGIAAVQVGILKRIVLVSIFEDEENPDSDMITIEMINPIITERTEGEQESTEGCLSVPGTTGVVKRPQGVLVSYLDREGVEHTEEFLGFGAIVVSHELDHLDGILYIDKATDIKKEHIEE